MTHTNHHPRKRFGQHFLEDQGVITRLIAAIAPEPTEHLVEIGPGLGVLTRELAPLAISLDAVEIDRDLIHVLEKLVLLYPNLKVHQADALKFDFTTLTTAGQKLRVVGNLPYNISTPLLFHLLDQMTVIEDMHFMLQKEVVERMAANPGTHSYGRLSVMVQYKCQVEELFVVPASAFNPPPKVESAVVRLIPYAQLPFVATDFARFGLIVRQAFSQRRKMLHNCLKDLVSVADLERLGIDANARPEQLSVADFVKISNIRSTD
jgi:16S rRNA (adenine1518-N6/adenine1519-N6)-dimethyltransferase